MGTPAAGPQRTLARDTEMTDAKLQNALDHLAATELVKQNVSFDFEKFLNEVGPAPTFAEPLGPTPDCLTVDVIHFFHLKKLDDSKRSFVEQHVSTCTTCAGLLTSYGESRPRTMPEGLYRRISTRMTNTRRDGSVEENAQRKRKFVWPRLPQLARWVTAPIAALVILFWVFAPATPYFEQTSSRFRDAWLAFRQKEIAVPNDPSELQNMLNRWVQASNRGHLPPPHQVDRMLETVSMKSTQPSPEDPAARLWTAGRTQLAAIDALSHYEALRKETGNDTVSLKQLKVSQVRDVNGVPAIAVDSNEINDGSVQALLEKSVAQSGLSRLYVFQGNRLVYDITPNQEGGSPSPK
jgi:hypothetical protein